MTAQLNKKDFTQDDIAKEIGVHKSTIRESLSEIQVSEAICPTDDEEVYNVIKKLNNRPRKTLGFRTPFQLMQKSFTRTGIFCVALQS
ncbi:MAG: hypothetical protein LC437_00910 [Thiohalomonas sp.]|nr:hypothetical protein [Thiohalomonas sp.]